MIITVYLKWISILLLIFKTVFVAAYTVAEDTKSADRTKPVDSCSVSLAVEYSPPFWFKNESGQWAGLSYELSAAVINEAGCEVVVKELPWAKAMLMLASGKLDMQDSVSYTKERAAYLHYLGEQYREEAQLLVGEDSGFKIESMSDLATLPRTVGYRRGAWYGAEFKALLEDERLSQKFIPVSGFRAAKSAAKLILSGDISGYLWLSIPGMDAELLEEGLTFHPKVLNSEPVYFALSKRSVSEPKYQRLKAAYHRAKERGIFKEILKKYATKRRYSALAE